MNILFTSSLWDNFYPAMIFCLGLSLTPGPNNLLLASSGIKFGYVRSVRVILAMNLGIFFMVLAILLGFSVFLDEHEIIKKTIAWIGVVFLIYLGIKIILSDLSRSDSKLENPHGFWKMYFFQFSNMKTFILYTMLISVFSKDNSNWMTNLVFWTIILTVSIWLSASFWLFIGIGASKFLSSRYLKFFNVSMGLLLIGFALYLIPFEDIIDGATFLKTNNS